MNSFRLKCTEGDRDSLSIKSTLDRSYFLDKKTDELVHFDKDDIVILKNSREDPCTITLINGENSTFGATVFRSSRGPAFALRVDKEERTYKMGGGEVLTITTQCFKDRGVRAHENGGFAQGASGAF